MLYFNEKGSDLCFRTDHTNQSFFQKTRCVFLLQLLAAATLHSLRNPSFTRESHFPWQSPCLTPVPDQPGHFENSLGTVCPADRLWLLEPFAQQIACDFSGLLFSGNMGSVREGTHLQQCTTCCAVLHCHNKGWMMLTEISNLFVSWVRLISVRSWFGFFFFYFSPTFLPCIKQLISGSPYSISKTWLWSWLWNGLNILFTQICFHALRESWGATHASLTATTTFMPAESLSLTSCSDETELMVSHSHTP